MAKMNNSDQINAIVLYCGVRTGHFGAGSHIGYLLSLLKKSTKYRLTLIKTDDRTVKEVTYLRENGFDVFSIPQPENKLFLTADINVVQNVYSVRIAEFIYEIVKNMNNVLIISNSCDYINVCYNLRQLVTFRLVYIHHSWAWKKNHNVPDDVYAGQISEVLTTYLNEENNNCRQDPSRFIGDKFSLVKNQYEMSLLSDLVVTVTKQANVFFTKSLRLDGSKVKTIYNGIDFASVTNLGQEGASFQSPRKKREKIILFVGRIKRSKGVEYLIKSFKLLVCEMPNTRLVLAGSGDISEFIPLTGPFWDKITFTGELNQQDLNKWYSVADVGVLPSLHEQCSYAAIEFRAHKVPIIVSSVDGLDEVFEHNVDSLKLDILLDNNGQKKVDEWQLYEYMKLILSSSQVARSLSDNGYRRAVNHFNSEIMLQEYNSTFLSLFEEM